jgi:ABC-type glycerol-3-phosphate transport system substrate-binding protein
MAEGISVERDSRPRSSYRAARRFMGACSLVAAASMVLVASSSGVSGANASHSSGGKKVTITMWNDPLDASTTGVPLSKSWLTAAVKMFEAENRDIKVNLIQEPFAASTAFETLLHSTEVGGTTPTIGQLYVGGQVIENAKYLVPLNKYLKKSFIESLSGWQFVTTGYRAGGKIYAVPYGTGAYYSVYYNKKLMAKAGVKPPWPTTWTGLIALGKKIKAKGVQPFEFGEKEGYQGAWTQDGLISGLDGNTGVLKMFFGEVSLNSPLLIRPYQAWHEMYAAGITNPNAPSLSETQGIADFAAGTGAMTITGNFENTKFQTGLGKNNVGLFPIPVLKGSKYDKVFSGGPNNAYVIFKTSKHISADLKLIKFLTSLKVQVKSINALGQIPNNISFRPTPAFYKQQPLLAQVYSYLKKGYKQYEAFDNVMPGSIDTYWYKTNNGVFGGTLSPAAAAASIQTQMQSYLQSNK